MEIERTQHIGFTGGSLEGKSTNIRKACREEQKRMGLIRQTHD